MLGNTNKVGKKHKPVSITHVATATGLLRIFVKKESSDTEFEFPLAIL